MPVLACKRLTLTLFASALVVWLLSWPNFIASASERSTATEFLLAPGDTLKFDILDDEKEPVDLLIASDGSIQAPYLGAASVAGRTVSTALDHLMALYKERKIFVVPKVGLSIASYRPVFVIGDVRQPGVYPFQAKLTVEKAMGLAGGQITAASAEDPVLARARLHGELEAIETTIIREGLTIARLTAVLADRREIQDGDIPETARPYVKGPVAETMRAVELRILESERDGFEAQKVILAEGVTEALRGQDLLKALEGKVSQSIEFSRADLERGQGLQKRGIKTLTDVSNLERQLTMEEARQLQVLSELSNGRRGIGTLKSQLAQLEQTRHMQALTELQSHTAELAASISKRRTSEEQLMLLSAMSAQEMAANKEVVLDFTIRRETADAVAGLPATPATLLEPGDVVVVSIRSSHETVPLAAAAQSLGGQPSQ